jgi:hypothetical protein
MSGNLRSFTCEELDEIWKSIKLSIKGECIPEAKEIFEKELVPFFERLEIREKAKIEFVDYAKMPGFILYAGYSKNKISDEIKRTLQRFIDECDVLYIGCSLTIISPTRVGYFLSISCYTKIKVPTKRSIRQREITDEWETSIFHL